MAQREAPKPDRIKPRSVRIPTELWSAVKQLAYARGITVTDVIVGALREFVRAQGTDPVEPAEAAPPVLTTDDVTDDELRLVQLLRGTPDTPKPLRGVVAADVTTAL